MTIDYWQVRLGGCRIARVSLLGFVPEALVCSSISTLSMQIFEVVVNAEHYPLLVTGQFADTSEAPMSKTSPSPPMLE